MRQLFQLSVSFLGLLGALFFISIFPKPFIEFIPEQISNPFDSDQVFFLVLGVDDAGEAGSDRTDAIMMVGMDVKTSAFELLSIPRDLLISDPKDNTKKIKINSVYKNDGLDAIKKEIENLLDLKIEKYAIIDYSLFKYLGDLVGPVEIMVDYPMHYEDNQQDLSIHFEQGLHKMYGNDLLNYIRYRDDSKGDLGRIERQKKAIKSTLIRFKDSISFEFIENEFKLILERMNTDFSTQDIIYTLLSLTDIDDVKFFSYPYKIASDGSIYTDDKLLKSLKNGFRNFKQEEKQQEPGTINVINCSNQNSRVFSIVNYNILIGTDLNYFLINEKIDDEIIEKLKGNTIMFFSNNNPTKNEELAGQFKSLYGMDFDLIYTNDLKVLSLYYQTIDSLMQSRQFYPTPLDALVYINHQ